MIVIGTCSPCFLEHISSFVMILSHQIFYSSSLSLSLTSGMQELTLTWHCKLLSTLDLQSGKLLEQGPLPASPSPSTFFRTMPVITKEVVGPHLTCMGHCSSSLQFLLKDKKVLVRHVVKTPQKQSSIEPLFLGEAFPPFTGYNSPLCDTQNHWCVPMTLQLVRIHPRQEAPSLKELHHSCEFHTFSTNSRP